MRLAWIGVAAPLMLFGIAGCGPNEDDVYCGPGAGCVCSGCPVVDAGFDVTPPSTTPMLVRVESGKTLTADPGNGVGVFVQYATGGHWTVWWTCDTNKTGEACNYEINATAKGGSVTGLAGYDGTTLSPSEDGGFDDAGFDGGIDAGPLSFPIQGQTTNQIQGVIFDTNPGAILEITQSLNNNFDGNLFYFVDGDKVKDGYKGNLTDPLDFQPTSP